MANYAEVESLVERYDRQIADLENAVIEKINRQLLRGMVGISRELRKEYASLQEEGGLMFALKLKKYEKLRKLLAEILPESDQQIYEQLLEDAIQLASEMGAQQSKDLIEKINPEFEFPDSFSDVPVEAIAAQARDGVKRLYRYTEQFQLEASAIVEQGLLRGWGPRKVLNEMRTRLNVTRSKAETLARTEMMSAFNTAADFRYEQAGIEYFQWMVAKSEALCSYCAARNMKVYKRGEGVMIVPAHPRCRCVILPWDPSWQELGFTDDEFAAKFRKDGLALIKEQGLRPNYGPTPFEKASGLKTAPKAVWAP